MKRLLLLSCITLVCFAISQAQNEQQKYELNVGDFNKLRITDGLNVTYRCNSDSAGIAVFSATINEMRSLLFYNKRSTLLIQMSTNDAIAGNAMPHITVYSSAITELENESDSTLFVENVISDKKIKLKLSKNGKIIARGIEAREVEAKILTGNGEIVIAGNCNKANLRCTGIGNIDAGKLHAKDVDCMILGTGSVTCHVDNGKLVTKGSGPGRVYYHGTPSKIKSYHLGRLKTISDNDDNEQSDTTSIYNDAEYHKI